MAAPVLAHKKFYIVKPAGGYNYIKNPAFAKPVGVTYWTAAGATMAITGDEQRYGAYSMKVTPTASDAAYVTYSGLAVTAGLSYRFSCYVKGVAGQAMRIYLGADAATTFTATGCWQRVQVNKIIAAGTTETYVVVQRDATASTLPFYVDGAQFEQATKMTTFMEGYREGCGWVGLPYHSATWRDPLSTAGGLLVDLEDYCEIVRVVGLGHGDWNQIMTKMTSGGDMYQTHIRKSRNFSIVVDFSGDTLAEVESNRAAVIDLLRPDLAEGQERIIRYQGVDVDGYEATQPVDIRCVPLPATMVDTPDLPTYQRDILNFAIPSGLLNGAYNEGKELDLYADFPTEFIVKRDPQGNWAKWTGSAYASLITGLGYTVFCMAEGPDGKIYVGGEFTNAGGITGANYLARWNPVTEAWEAVVAGINGFVFSLMFDANGDLYVGGMFTNLGSASGNRIVKITNLSGTPTVNALGTGLNSGCNAIAIAPNGAVYAGGAFTLAGGVANTSRIAKWNGTSWSALATGLNEVVYALAFAPNGDLYIGGSFTDAAYPYLCKWNRTAFSAVGTNTDINYTVRALAFGATGWLYVGGGFTNAGGNPNADYIARWGSSRWESLGTGTNNLIYDIAVSSGKVYASGAFTSAGGLALTDRIAVWSNGAWQPLDVDLPGLGYILSILPASDGSLYIGGEFSTATAGENAKTGVVALNLNLTSASANTYPYMQIRGPGTLKVITNHTTGKSVMFDGITLNAGEWIGLNFNPLNLKFRGGWEGRGNLMRYVIAGSDYGDFYLTPGANNLSLFMDGTNSNSGAWIAWTPLFWGLDGAVLK